MVKPSASYCLTALTVLCHGSPNMTSQSAAIGITNKCIFVLYPCNASVTVARPETSVVWPHTVVISILLNGCTLIFIKAQNCFEMQFAADPESNMMFALAPDMAPLKMLDSCSLSVKTEGGSCQILHRLFRRPTV